MLDVFKDAALCKYRRNIVTSSSRSFLNGNTEFAEKIIEFNNGTPIIKGKLNDFNLVNTIKFD